MGGFSSVLIVVPRLDGQKNLQLRAIRSKNVSQVVEQTWKELLAF